MEVTVKIFRYNPEKDTRGHYETYKIEADPNDRVLDVLEHIKGKTDGTLSFRRSCAHGVCGSDAMRINGSNHLACKTLVRDVGANITVEPLLGMKVAKDLIVDMDPFFDNYKKMLPYLINESPLPADGRNVCKAPSNARASTNRPSVFCARRVRHPARPIGRVMSIMVPPRSWPHIALSLTAAMKAPLNVWKC